MSDSSTEFEAFTDLPAALQEDAIREGEDRLRAQLEVANAADARALNLTAMLIASITAALGGGVAFLTRDKPDYFAVLLSFGFGALLIRSAATASSAILPDLFHLPGNSPKHWLPTEWDATGSERVLIERARREQAEAIAHAIAENAKQANRRAECVKESLRQVREAVCAAAIGLFALTIFGIASMHNAA